MAADSFADDRSATLAIAHGDPLPADAQPKSLSRGLAAAVALFPQGRFVFVSPDADRSATYAETFDRASRIAGGLHRAGVRPGDRLVLHFSAFADFVPAMWGSLLAGAVALPLTRNESSRHNISRAPRLLAHLRTALEGPRIVGEPLADSGAISLSTLEESEPAEDFHDGSLDDPRVLILTSGTTAAPNLVTLSARALIHRWWPAMPDPEHAATFLSWSPFDHVMGLGLAGPNLPAKVHLPAQAFVQSPLLWLSTLERHRVTHCTMTNFGMSLVERTVAVGGRSFDLSSVAKIGVGAEAIVPDVCRRFVTALRPFGLRSDAVILGYGLTECGPVVGGDHAYSLDEDAGSGPFPSLDRPTRGHSVRIVGDGRVLPERKTGAIEVRGPTMTLGYYGDPAATRALFTADGWLKTGDLGWLDGGRLTVMGREKEIIVISAKKFACAEIEAIALSVPGIDAAYAVSAKARGSAAGPAPRSPFALFVAGRSLAGPDAGPLLRRVRSRIATHFGVAPAFLLPISEAAVPRTATGKVQRLALAAQLDAGAFDPLLATTKPLLDPANAVAYASESEQRMALLWADILGIDRCARDADFFDLGGDSLSAESLLLAVDQAFGKRLPPELLRERTTIARLAAFIDGRAPEVPEVPGAANMMPAPKRPAAIRFKRDTKTLNWSLAIAPSWSAPVDDRLYATEYLVAYGLADEADAAMRQLLGQLVPEGMGLSRHMQQLKAANAYFRHIGIPQQIRSLGKLGEQLLSSTVEGLLWARPESGKLLVVFNTMFGDFWVSGAVLHCLLRNLGASVLYLKDPGERRYLDGLKTLGKGFDGMIEGVARFAEKAGARDIYTMGFSSGAYAALLAAAKLRAAGYLGFSLRPPDPGFDAGLPPDYLAEARSLIESRAAPTTGHLYYGDEEPRDGAIAMELARLPGFAATKLGGTRHNTVMALIAAGKFERSVARLLA